MASFQKISACLWFDNQAEEAARHYTSVFRNSRIVNLTHFGKAGFEIHGRPEGSVMTVVFELEGQEFTALNGGPLFKFTEAVSLQVFCENQKEIDYYWEKLGAGGDPRAQQCGWLKDKFGLSWQVIPANMAEMFKEKPTPASERAMAAMLEMKKIDMAEIERAYRGS
jgi:predicted 3-demethylubiquinone-9 3-methyltransferase (glyoxalase superfamily)